MRIPQGFFVIYQPKYQVPSVFDLHPRGLFKVRPGVCAPFGLRVLADEHGNTKVQCAWLEKDQTRDDNGQIWDFGLKIELLDLDDHLELDSARLGEHIPDKAFIDALEQALSQWREAYLPKEGNTFVQDLKNKIKASVKEQKDRLYSRLSTINHDWVMARLPKRLQVFRTYIYPLVRDTLFRAYQDQGGKFDESRLVRLVVMFDCIFEHEQTDLFARIEHAGLDKENQAWDCWAGFVGSEDEAQRIHGVMEAVFRPLVPKMAA